MVGRCLGNGVLKIGICGGCDGGESGGAAEKCVSALVVKVVGSFFWSSDVNQ